VNARIRTILFWLVVVVAASILWQVVHGGGNKPQIPEISYSEFLAQVDAGNVTTVTILKDEVDGRYRNNASFRVIPPSNPESMLQTLRQKNVEIWFKNTAAGDWPAILVNLAPLALLAALWFFMIRQFKAKKVQEPPDRGVQGDDVGWPK
jgi:cell division protease FtsH